MMLRIIRSWPFSSRFTILAAEILSKSNLKSKDARKVCQLFNLYIHTLESWKRKTPTQILKLLHTKTFMWSFVRWDSYKEPGSIFGINFGRVRFVDLFQVHAIVCDAFAKEHITLIKVVTGTGLGYCYQDISVGDQITLVTGVSVPLITRGDRRSTKLVGVGIFDNKQMRGDAWRDALRERRRVRSTNPQTIDHNSNSTSQYCEAENLLEDIVFS